MSRTCQGVAAALAAAALGGVAGCAGTAAPASSPDRAASSTQTSTAPEPVPSPPVAGSDMESLIGKEWRFSDPTEDDASYFVMQPDGTLTWFTWLIGGQDWAQHDNSTWTADGPNVTFRVNDDFATMTGTLADGKLTGTGTNLDGLNFTWTAEPGGGTRVP